MKPSICRMVVYAPSKDDPAHNGAPVLPAVITRVWSDTCVNLKVINDEDRDFWVTSVVQGDGVRNWNWPPRA